LETPQESATEEVFGVDIIGTSTPATVAESVDLALPACRLVGPFETRREANTQARALRKQGLDVALETHNVPARAGYQVVIADIPSRKAAEDLIARFRSAGIDDYFMKHRDHPPHEISLGLYKGTETAKDHADVLRAKGFDATIIPWLKKSDRSFLAIRGSLDETALAALEVLPKPAAGMLSSQPHCEQFASR
jgi:hypothetical protein